jgi:hypothetical protein
MVDPMPDGRHADNDNGRGYERELSDEIEIGPPKKSGCGTRWFRTCRVSPDARLDLHVAQRRVIAIAALMRGSAANAARVSGINDVNFVANIRSHWERHMKLIFVTIHVPQR